MTASPVAETAQPPSAESSFNLQPVASPRADTNPPGKEHTPKGKDVRFLMTTQRLGNSPLTPKDSNSPGAGVLLIDVETSESRDCASTC